MWVNHILHQVKTMYTFRMKEKFLSCKAYIEERINLYHVGQRSCISYFNKEKLMYRVTSARWQNRRFECRFLHRNTDLKATHG